MTKTTEDHILQTLNNIQKTFYRDQPPRIFYRDKRHLLKAITRYAYECESRHWLFSADFIFAEINGLLNRIQQTRADFDYLPAYLEQSVRNRVNYHAEELSAESKAINNITGRVVKGLPDGRPDAEELKRERVTETLSSMFKVLRQPKAKPLGKQMRLL